MVGPLTPSLSLLPESLRPIKIIEHYSAVESENNNKEVYKQQNEYLLGQISNNIDVDSTSHEDLGNYKKKL